MKTKTDSPAGSNRPTEAEIREYAHHLYISSGWLPGRDLDNWLQAEAHLIAERQEHGSVAKHSRRRPAPFKEAKFATETAVLPYGP